MMINCSLAGTRAEFPYNDKANDGCISVTLEKTFFRKAEVVSWDWTAQEPMDTETKMYLLTLLACYKPSALRGPLNG